MNPCPRCGMLDQVRGIPAIMYNDVRHSDSVGAIKFRGRTSGSAGGSVSMAGSISQHFVVSSPLAKTLAGTVFLDPRYAGETRHPASVPLFIGAVLLTALSLPIGWKIVDGMFNMLMVLMFVPLTVGMIAIPLASLVGTKLDRTAAAADLPKLYARQRAVQRGALWESLAYCGRDHVVYDPRTGAHFPPEGTTGYLFHTIPEVEFIAVTDNLDGAGRPTDLR